VNRSRRWLRDLRLELVGGTLGDDPATVEHGDVGQLVRFLQVLGGEEDGGATGDQGAHRVPHGAAA
jgi:hypothetical protein